jgi:hypothetical protein
MGLGFDKAILIGRRVCLEDDVLEWARWLEHANRQLARITIHDMLISTVFLGLDHGYGGKHLWFETMVFRDRHDIYCKRYETWDEALAGHMHAVQLAHDGKLSERISE